MNVSYKYNDSGIRTEKTVNGVKTTYTLEGSKVIMEQTGSDTIYYSYGPGGSPISMNLNGAEYYYVYNATNDIIGIVNGSGTLVVSYTYDSWGKLISIDGSLKDTVGVKNPYRYKGYRYDTETGLYYLQSRYYNPQWGRFINADNPVVLNLRLNEVTDKNLFAYCDNNPISRIDTDGYYWQFAVAGSGTLASTLLIGGANFWNPVGWVILGTAAVLTAYVGYRVYMAKRDTRQTGSVTKGMSSKQRKAYSHEIHRYKRENGMRPNDNLPYWILEEISREIRRNYK